MLNNNFFGKVSPLLVINIRKTAKRFYEHELQMINVLINKTQSGIIEQNLNMHKMGILKNKNNHSSFDISYKTPLPPWK